MRLEDCFFWALLLPWRVVLPFHPAPHRPHVALDLCCIAQSCGTTVAPVAPAAASICQCRTGVGDAAAGQASPPSSLPLPVPLLTTWVPLHAFAQGGAGQGRGGRECPPRGPSLGVSLGGLGNCSGPVCAGGR